MFQATNQILIGLTTLSDIFSLILPQLRLAEGLDFHEGNLRSRQLGVSCATTIGDVHTAVCQNQ